LGKVFYENKKLAHDRFKIYQGRVIFTRGATLIHVYKYTLSFGYQHILYNLRMYSRHRILSLSKAFDYALSGPFNKLHFYPASSYPDSL